MRHSLLIAAAFVLGLVTLTQLPVGQAQVLPFSHSSYLAIIFKALPSPTASPAPPSPTPKATQIPTTTPRSSRCSSAYPTVCIPPPPPDLDCGDITYRNFTVLSPDPHKFDTDGDGIGCETR